MGTSIAAPQPSAPPSAPKRTRRARTAAAIVVALALIVVVLATPDAAASTISGSPAHVGTWDGEHLGATDMDPLTGLIHVVDLEHPASVSVRDSSGRQLSRYGQGALTVPGHVAFTADSFLVTDLLNGRVEHFDRQTQQHIGFFGGERLSAPRGITAHGGEIFVENVDSVEVFASNGAWRRSITGAGTPGGLEAANGLAVHGDRLFVTDYLTDQIVVFDLDGTYITSLGSNAGLVGAVDVDITTAGLMYVTDFDGDRVVVFVLQTGIVIPPIVFGQPRGLQSAFEVTSFEVPDPVGIAVDPGGMSMWVGTAAGVVETFTHATCGTTGSILQTNGTVPTIVGASFDDDLVGTDGADVVFLDAGDDTVDLGDGANIACGGDGNDIVTGGDDADWIMGDAGNDTVFGGGAGDRLEGGPGVDELYGGAGADYVTGGAGADRIVGGIGDDVMLGESGADRIEGSGGRDLLDGGADDDTLDGGTGNDRLIGGRGNDLLRGQDGRDVLRGGAGADVAEGGRHNDRLSGNGGADVLRGGNGRDRLNGNAGDDTVLGGGGNDRLWGGAGVDRLDGQVGVDYCAYELDRRNCEVDL